MADLSTTISIESKISSSITQELSPTPYACTSLTQLTGGTANFVFRGVLKQPLSDGTGSIVIKHGEDYVASNTEFKIPTERCLIEEIILKALNECSAYHGDNITVKSPHIYYFNKDTNTQILEDLPSARDLKSYILSNPTIPKELSRSIGQALGNWLLFFHRWVSETNQSYLSTEMEKNELMQGLKFSINYENLVAMVDRFPGILGESKAVFEAVRDRAKMEVGRKDGEGFGVIHGDFWSGNVLIPSDLNTPKTTLFITDWELAQCGARALDLGQMIAELYMLKHFKDIDAGLWLIEGFAEGYRAQLNEDLAFRTVIHVGVHLVCWGSTIQGWGSEEQVEEVVKVGRDFVVKGWGRERGWFENTVLNCLF